MHMKKKISIEFFPESKKWSRRMPKIKKISIKTVNKMNYILIKILLSNKPDFIRQKINRT